MTELEGNFKGIRNFNIYYQGWLPKGEAKAVLLIVHGLGEHIGRYGNIVNHFVPLGYAVYGFDHIGHGKSAGEREVIDRFEDFTDNLTIFKNMVMVWQPNKPLFLLGHSLGGEIVAYYLLDNPTDIKGAIISAPSVKIPSNITSMTIFMGRILSTIAPKSGIILLDATGVSKDPEVVKAYINDPLVFHDKTPARMAAEMLKGMQRITAENDKINLPFIAVQGDEDRLIDPAGTQMLFDKASSKDKTIKLYPGLHHEVFNEPEREMVLKDVENWLASHT